jgi:hypothetical protein
VGLSAGGRDEQHALHPFHQSLQEGYSALHGHCLLFLHSPLHEQIGLLGSIVQPGHYALQLRVLPSLPLETELDVVVGFQHDLIGIFFFGTRATSGG